MMRKLLLSTAALAVLSAPAFAADLPSRSAQPAAPVVYAPIFTWTGLYVGVNAGVGFNQSNNVTITAPAALGGGSTTYSSGDNNGFVGGGQIGYNWQTGAFVFGVEADIQYANLGRDNTFAGIAYGSDSNDSYFGTVRGRVGYAFDRALIYVTGGLAYGDIGAGFGNDDAEAGWTVGGGLEYAFTNNWTAKIEGLYVNIDRGRSFVTVAGPGGAYTAVSDSNSDFGVVRVGLNYKF